MSDLKGKILDDIGKLWPGSSGGLVESVSITEGELKHLAGGDPVLFYWIPQRRYDQPAVIHRILRIEIEHSDNPITIIYEYNDTQKKASITAEGLYEATGRDIQMILPVIARLNAGGNMARPTGEDYDRYFERLEDGEDWKTVKADYLAKTSGTSNAFNKAMQRRRKER